MDADGCDPNCATAKAFDALLQDMRPELEKHGGNYKACELGPFFATLRGNPEWDARYKAIGAACGKCALKCAWTTLDLDKWDMVSKGEGGHGRTGEALPA